MNRAEIIKAGERIADWFGAEEAGETIRSLIALVPKDGYVVVPEEPFGYAVVNDQGYFVGIWREEQIAKDICTKGQPSHHQKVVPVAMLKAAKEEK